MMTSGNDKDKCSVIGCDQRVMTMLSFMPIEDYNDSLVMIGNDEYPLCHPHYRFLKALNEVVMSGQGVIDVRPEDKTVRISP